MRDTEHLAQLVTKRTGVELSRGGLLDALHRYVERRRAELGLGRFEDYLALVEAPDRRELNRLIEIISVPHTWFFRDMEQLQAMQRFLEKAARQRGTLKVWVPACATGEDAYSLALMLETMRVDAKVVGSDLCSQSLSLARRAVFGAFSMRSVPEVYLPYFQRQGRTFRLSERVASKVRFVEHNLLEPVLREPGGWDAILCRNVFIYFSRETAENCAGRLGRSLSDDGIVMFGAGELIGARLAGLLADMSQERIAYRRSADRAASQRIPQKMRNDTMKQAPAFRLPSPVLFAEDARSVEPRLSSTELLKVENVLSASAESPMDSEARMLSGIALYAAGDLERAHHELRAALMLNGSLWAAAIYQGLCLESMGHPQLARAEFRHAVRVLEQGPELRWSVPEELTGLVGDLFELAKRKSA